MKNTIKTILILAGSAVFCEAMADKPRFLCEYTEYNMHALKGDVRIVLEKLHGFDDGYGIPENDPVWETVTTYGVDGNVELRNTSYRRTPHNDNMQKYTHDAENNRLVVNEISSKGLPRNKYIYDYDGNGRLVRVSDCDTDGEPYEVYELEYAGDGLSRITYFDGEGNNTGFREVFTENEIRKEYETTDTQELYTYNANGDIAECRYVGDDEDVAIIAAYWEYTYDEAGNWIKRVQSWQWRDEPEPVYIDITTREIVYRQ